ncbi:hypothetical protein D3C85_1428070 [compost metagenome]
MNVGRRKVVGHRIQDGKAIVDIVLYRKDKPMPESWPVKWVGDAYALRDELNAVIAHLERKKS